MNIFGEGFPKEIISQVEQRQKIYGSGYITNRSPKEIIYLNGNSSWCKLLSSVDVSNIDLVNSQTIKDLKLTGVDLAKQFILFGGVTDRFSEEWTPRSGISNTNNLFGGAPNFSYNNTTSTIIGGAAYGIGGTDFGLRPMMGIQTVSVTHENRGSLRRAQVKLKAFNKAQFEIIDILYLRLGFSVLLEWGHSMYFDEKYELKTGSDINNSLSNEFIQQFGKIDGNYKNLTYEDFLKLINKKRLESNGNYDAMFAKVTNFQWSFMPDGSYDITVNLASVGDIIESLKVNVLLQDNTYTPIKPSDSSDEDEEKTTEQKIIAGASNSTIGKFLNSLVTLFHARGINIGKEEGDHQFYYSMSDIPSSAVKSNPDENVYLYEDSLFELTGTSTTRYYRYFEKSDVIIYYDIKTFEDRDDEVSESETIINASIDDPDLVEEIKTNGRISKITTGGGALTGPDFSFDPTKFEKGHRDVVKIIWNGNGEGNQYYIRLGTFLQFIQNEIMLHQKPLKDGDLSSSLEFDFETKSNLIYVDPLQISVDPRTCIVNKSLSVKNPYGGATVYNFNTACDNFISSNINIPNTQYGQIMNLYVNMVKILEVIDSNKDDKGTIVLIDFLQKLLDEINTALGGINDFDVFIDETLNSVKVIDKNPLPNKDEILTQLKNLTSDIPLPFDTSSISTELVNFSLYGYSGSNAGFIKDFSFTTELSPAFSTMITVGAAANGTVVGANETALSKLNKGLTDRFKAIMINGSDTEVLKINETDKAKENYIALKDKYQLTLEEYTAFLIELSTEKWELNTDNIDTYKGVLPNLLQMDKEIQQTQERLLAKTNPNAQNSIATGTGFIPFNLSITMEGLSGMKINQKFTVDSSYLPSNYPTSVEFLIKNIQHEISNNKWYTKLESYCISKGNFTEKTDISLNTTSPVEGFIENNAFLPIGQCGAPISFPIPPASVTPPSLIQKTAMKKALDAVFTAGEGTTACSKYTYNIATNYINSLNNKPIENGIVVTRKGHAKAASTRTYLQSLGYTSYKIGENFTKTGTVNSIENFFKLAKFNIGDIVIYWANDGNQADSWVQYGHIQIYTEGTPGYGKWASDKKTNFGNSNFVYRSKSSECWNIYLLKAPSQITSGVVPAASTVIPGATSF